MQRAAIFASATPVALETNGTVREARGLTSSMKITSSPLSSTWIANCVFIRPTTFSARASATTCSRSCVLDLRPTANTAAASTTNRRNARRLPRCAPSCRRSARCPVLSAITSTSTSTALSRKRSSSTGESFDTLAPLRACSARGRRRRARLPSRGRRARSSAAPPADSRSRARARALRRRLRAVRFGGCVRPSFSTSFWKRSRSSARSIESGDVPMIGTPLASSARASFSGVCPPYCTITPFGLLRVDDLEHVLERQRLEVQAVGRVVIGRHGFRIAVDHDRFVAVLAQRERGVHAAVVELDALPDAVRAAAEHDDLVARRSAAPRIRPRRSNTGRRWWWRTRPRRNPRACRPDARRTRGAGARTAFSSVPTSCARRASEKPLRLSAAHAPGIERVEAGGDDVGFDRDQFLDLVEEPRIDVRQREHVLDRQAGAERIGDVEHALGTGFLELAAQGDQVVLVRQVQAGRIEPVLAGFQPAQRLLQRFLEGAADRHHLADRFHLRGQARIGRREFLEREARDLGDDVVDRSARTMPASCRR